MIDYAREIDEARDCEDMDSLRYELEQDAREDDEPSSSPCRSPYRCVRGDCGARDCSRCCPGNAPDGAFDEAEPCE